METQIPEIFKTAYNAFNSRNIDAALNVMHPDVQWPKAFEGGYVTGPEAIRDYWTRQWTEINPHVEPVSVVERPDGTFELTIHQVVKDLQGSVLFDGLVKHVYTLEGGLLRKMEVEV